MRALSLLLGSCSTLLIHAVPAAAQVAADPSVPAPEAVADAETSGDIVITARRREESLQDVPTTVNVVTSAAIEKLNIRNFNEIQALVPGLTLTPGPVYANSATVRGVAFNTGISGNNATVEFYLNDAPIASNFVFQSMFDVGQFELLRGPQGTLRGRASPSGSITLTTRRPNLAEPGLAAAFTAANSNSYKGDFALNIPIVSDVLGVRLAGVIDDNDGNRVHSIKEHPSYSPPPFRRTEALRGSLRFEPVDWANLDVMYQTLKYRTQQYNQAISATFVTGAPPATVPVIEPSDRLSIEDTGSPQGTDQEILVVNGHVRFVGQRLSYVGSFSTQDFFNLERADPADFFSLARFPLATRPFGDPANSPQVCNEVGPRTKVTLTNQAYVQCTKGFAKRHAHEIRLSSETRVADIFHYVVGVLRDKNDNSTVITQETPVFIPNANAVAVALTAIDRKAESVEKSAFANVTAHLRDRLEISAGIRRIKYSDVSSLVVAGTPLLPGLREKRGATIYSGSVKYNVSDDLMVYASTGTSWRPGPRVIGNFNLRLSDLERSFLNLPDEKSTSYEIGLKTSFAQRRGRLSVSAFKQDFVNYPYAVGGVFFINYSLINGAITPGVTSFGFAAGVPVKVKGIELEAAYQIMPRWSVSGSFSYADAKISNGVVPCNDLNGDGIPDINAPLPSLQVLQAAVGPGQNISQCRFSGPATNTAKWGLSIQSEAGFDIVPGVDGFVRGLATYTPSYIANPSNTNDDVNGYPLFNVYAGVRGSSGDWEISLFAKNIFNKRRLLGLGAAPLSTAVRTPTGSITYVSDYYGVSLNDARELGISLRLAVGSR